MPTTVNGVLSFASGANVALSASWDVWKHQRLPFEIYGTEGSMLVPDPNFFGGAPMVSERDADWRELDITAHPFRVPNRTLAAAPRSPTTGSSACSTWLRPCTRAGRIGRTAISPCTCWR